MTQSLFVLDKTLEKDSFFITDLSLCRVLLSNNSQIPWIILVPRISNMINLLDLSHDERHILMNELHFMSQIMTNIFQPYRLNVAALGNVVEQMHWHIIVRYQDDACFPSPIWGNIAPAFYTPQKAEQRINVIKKR